MKLVVVECEWEMGLNGDNFNQPHLGFYSTMQEAVLAAREAYELLFDANEESFYSVVEDGLISFTEEEI